jgi:hypothetical protein
MRRKLLPLILGGALSIAAVAPAAAGHTACHVDNRGGAAALVALVQAQVNAGVVVCDVNVLNNSLNNLLRNADINVLRNILNNSPFLNDWTITVTDNDILNQIQINILSVGGVNVGGVTIDGV